MTKKTTPRIAVVTGCTSGIGLQVAIGLARTGWRVVGLARSPLRGRRMTEIIRAQTGNPGVSFHAVDLSLMAETAAAGARLAVLHPRIDLLVNNAGAVFSRRETTAEGLEATFALNHLGPFVLTRALLPALEASPGARIVNVASAAHAGCTLCPDDLQMEEGRYRGWLQYRRSKLMNILFTRELARRLPGGITANAVHPGFVATSFARNTGPGWRWLVRLMMLTAMRPQEAARGVLQVALAPELAGVSGAYFDRGVPARPSPEASRDDLAAALWQSSSDLLEARSILKQSMPP